MYFLSFILEGAAPYAVQLLGIWPATNALFAPPEKKYGLFYALLSCSVVYLGNLKEEEKETN